MKKAFSVAILLISSKALALPVGNPTEASQYTNGIFWEGSSTSSFDPCSNFGRIACLRLGYYGDFVSNRFLNAGGHNHEDHGGRVLQKAELITNALYLALNVCHKADIFATLGSSHVHLWTNSNVFTQADGVSRAFETEFRFSPRFSWSIGARATLWEYNCFGLGVVGQYFHHRPNLDYVVDYEDGEKLNFNDVRSDFGEWQVGFGVSYRIATCFPTVAFIPYAALKWSRVDWKFDALVEEKIIHNFSSHKSWGYAIGLTFTFCDVSGITVEGRFGSEKALYVNGQVRF